MKSIEIQYFAVLREQCRKDSEFFETDAESAQGLYQELKEKYGFNLNMESLRVAINNEFVDWAAPLNDKDIIVFIPPVAGG